MSKEMNFENYKMFCEVNELDAVSTKSVKLFEEDKKKIKDVVENAIRSEKGNENFEMKIEEVDNVYALTKLFIETTKSLIFTERENQKEEKKNDC